MAIPLHNALPQADFPVSIAVNFDGVAVVLPRITRGKRVSAMTTLAAAIESSVLQEHAIPDTRLAIEPCSCGLAMVGHGEAYNEEAFHHFLAIERKRSEASSRPFLLLLVEFEKAPGVAAHIASEYAEQIFSGLAEGLRDTDVIGWYRHNRIAGAVLTDLGEAPEQTVRQQVTRRVTAALHACIPLAVASLAQIRVYQLPARVETSPGIQTRQLEKA